MDTKISTIVEVRSGFSIIELKSSPNFFDRFCKKLIKGPENACGK